MISRLTSARCRALLLSCLALAATTGAKAADPVQAVAAPPASAARPEFRLGAFLHDPTGPEEHGVDVNAELLLPLPVPADLSWRPFIPRFQAGSTVSTSGRTSHAYAGFAWTIDVAPRVFVEGSLGGAVNNGAAGPYVPVGRSNIGCHGSFRESASLGFRVTDGVTLMASIEHLSNAGLCSSNRGLTNVGLRMGYSF